MPKDEASSDDSVTQSDGTWASAKDRVAVTRRRDHDPRVHDVARGRARWCTGLAGAWGTYCRSMAEAGADSINQRSTSQGSTERGTVDRDRTDQVAVWLRDARTVTVLTGAGISTDSGIPDFRGPRGVWTTNPAAERLSNIADYLADPAVRVEAWKSRRDHPAWTARPNRAHEALVRLERAGLIHTVVTQNIDGLHQKAGSTRVVELHGTVWWAVCLECGLRTPMADVLARVDAGEPDPRCLSCGGIQKSATISFGQPLDRDVLAQAVRAAEESDLFLAVGTSLTVYPAAGLCDVALEAGARLVVINGQPTPYDEKAAAVLRDPIGEVLPRLADAALGEARA